MEDMIKRILDMDKKAQEITEAAQKEKSAAQEEIGRRAEALKVEYLDRARPPHPDQRRNRTDAARAGLAPPGG